MILICWEYPVANIFLVWICSCGDSNATVLEDSSIKATWYDVKNVEACSLIWLIKTEEQAASPIVPPNTRICVTAAIVTASRSCQP